MDVKEAYFTLEQYFSNEFIEGRKTRHVIESAENSWMMPLPWLYAATACARDGNREEFKRCLSGAVDMYVEFMSGSEPSDRVLEEEEAARTLRDNPDQAYELVRKIL